MFYKCRSLSIYIACVMSIWPSGQAVLAKQEKGRKNHLITALTWFRGKRARDAYNHSLVKGTRAASDCQPFCPKVDIWQYRYKGADGIIHTSSRPISTLKEHWKIPGEARIISTTLFGNQARYLDGMIDFINSFEYLRKANRIADPLWGYNSFTVRVYVAKRNPRDIDSLGPMDNATSKDFIERLLDMGCEIAYVDNKLPAVKKDATFWRFMVAAEAMPPGQKIRYLVRDVDWKLTAAEAYTVGRWIHSGLQFHRMQLFPVCMGPLIAGTYGGSHTGTDTLFTDMKTSIEHYPYRNLYGDDEMYLRDIVWPRMKFSGSVLTSMYKRGLKHNIANPYKHSCEEPTQKYCDEIADSSFSGKSPVCIDDLIPKEIKFPLTKMAEKNHSLDYLIREDNKSFIFPRLDSVKKSHFMDFY